MTLPPPEPEQLSFVPKIDPDALIAQVRAEHKPVGSVALFSGGNDSTVLAHRCREHYDSLAFIDTGTAVPGVREFVVEFAAWLGKPLRVLESGDTYRRMVLGWGLKPGLGMPGPGTHGRCLNQLKERRFRDLRRELQGDVRGARVLMLSGLRRAESQRRKTRQPITRDGAIVFANPLIDWTDEQMRAYRTAHGLPQSDVAALLHRSGECNCGAFAAPGEREELMALYPDWWQVMMGPLERECAARGLNATWGQRPARDPWRDDGEGIAPVCSDCQLRFEVAA